MSNTSEPFDENWYLFKNSDVADAVEKGFYATPYDHYIAAGRAEGRAPGPRDAKEQAELRLRKQFRKHHEAGFLAPSLLQLADTEFERVVVTGACQARELARTVEALGFTVDFINNPGLTGLPEYPKGKPYNFQLVWPALRDVMPDGIFSNVRHDDAGAYQRLFEESLGRLRLIIDESACMAPLASNCRFSFAIFWFRNRILSVV